MVRQKRKRRGLARMMARRTILVNDGRDLAVECDRILDNALRAANGNAMSNAKRDFMPALRQRMEHRAGKFIFIESGIRWPWFPFVYRFSGGDGVQCVTQVVLVATPRFFSSAAYRSSIRPRYRISPCFPKMTTSGVTVGLSNLTRRCCGSSKTGARKSYFRACSLAAAGVRSGSTCTM